MPASHRTPTLLVEARQQRQPDEAALEALQAGCCQRRCCCAVDRQERPRAGAAALLCRHAPPIPACRLPAPPRLLRLAGPPHWPASSRAATGGAARRCNEAWRFAGQGLSRCSATRRGSPAAGTEEGRAGGLQRVRMAASSLGVVRCSQKDPSSFTLLACTSSTATPTRCSPRRNAQAAAKQQQCLLACFTTTATAHEAAVRACLLYDKGQETCSPAAVRSRAPSGHGRPPPCCPAVAHAAAARRRPGCGSRGGQAGWG